MNKPTIVYVPLEPLAERYTESWYQNFPLLFDAAGFEVQTINGLPLENEVKVGTFLDINSTTHFKWTQLQIISKMFHEGEVKPHTIFFFGDLEFWGLEAVRLLAQMNNIPVYLTAFLHAASYTREDAFAIAAPYQKWTEVGWIAACDRVFVGSQYHANQVIKERLDPLNALGHKSRLCVTKNPIFLSDYPLAAQIGIPKQRKVLLTNRLDAEKRPLDTLKLFNNLIESGSADGWEFVLTTGRSTLRGDPRAVAMANSMASEGKLTLKVGISKAEYHRELREASIMVTHSIEENYGYCIAEAIIHKCLPLMRRGLSHNEFTNNWTLFFDDSESNFKTDFEAASSLISNWGTDNWPECPVLDTCGAHRIVEEMRGLLPP